MALKLLIKLLRRNKKGAAALEFALVAPLLFLLIFGILEFGLTIFLDSTLQQALRAVARQGMVQAQTQESIDSTMQYYMQGMWRDEGTLKVCARAYPNVMNVIEPRDATGARINGPAIMTPNAELAGFAANPLSMFGGTCGAVPSEQTQRGAVMLYTAEYQWGGFSNMMTAFIPDQLYAVTMVRNEFGD